MTTPELIKTLREKNVSLTRIASAANCNSTVTIYNWLNGKSEPLHTQHLALVKLLAKINRGEKVI